jgi:hypothetical protein
MLTVLGGLAEFERELIRSRTGEGRQRAKARGVVMGRRPKLTPHQRAEALARRDAGETLVDIARSYWAYRRSRPPIPTDRDHLFRTIATSSAARVLTAPLDDGGDVSLLGVGQARREAVPVVNRRDPRATRRALTADAAARAGGPC